jgi:hypothetical protein
MQTNNANECTELVQWSQALPLPRSMQPKSSSLQPLATRTMQQSLRRHPLGHSHLQDYQTVAAIAIGHPSPTRWLCRRFWLF